MMDRLTILILFTGCALIFGLVPYFFYKERKKNKFSPFTEPSLRSPGYTLGAQLDSARQKFDECILWLILTPIFYLLIVSLSPDQISTTFAILFVIPAVIAMIVFVRQFFARAAVIQKSRLGLDGEVFTGQELNYLMRDGAYVYHDIPYQYGNIDHVVLSTGGIFVVETKAVRKPANDDGKRQSSVTFENGKLKFPGFSTEKPVLQARRHAEHLQKYLKSKTGNEYPVIAVVALPGWYVEPNNSNDILVLNPKRGARLKSLVLRNLIAKEQVDILAGLIEEIARSVRSNTEKYDPDAGNKFNFWLERKNEERKIK